jgi:hypothetical protein
MSRSTAIALLTIGHSTRSIEDFLGERCIQYHARRIPIHFRRDLAILCLSTFRHDNG